MTNNKRRLRYWRKRQRFCKVIAEYAKTKQSKPMNYEEVEALDMAISALRPVSREREGGEGCGQDEMPRSS